MALGRMPQQPPTEEQRAKMELLVDSKSSNFVEILVELFNSK